jgi:hypothetical protein
MSEATVDKTRGCTTKVRYATLPEAQRAASALRARKGPKHPGYRPPAAYACGHCGGFHFGHRRP